MIDEFKRSVTLPFHDSLGLAVYRSGLQKCGAGFCWGPAIRDHYLIHYVISRKGLTTAAAFITRFPPAMVFWWFPTV